MVTEQYKRLRISLYKTIVKLMKNKYFQVVLVGVLIPAFVTLQSKIPNTFLLGKYAIDLSLLRVAGWFSVIVFILALLAMGFSQIGDIKPQMKQRLEKTYTHLYGFSFKVFGALVLLGASANLAIYLSFAIKNMTVENLQIVLAVLIFVIALYVLHKKGIRLTG